MAGERTCYRVDHVCGSRPNQLASMQTHGHYCATTNSGVEGQSGGWKVTVSQTQTNAKRDFFHGCRETDNKLSRKPFSKPTRSCLPLVRRFTTASTILGWFTVFHYG